MTKVNLFIVIALISTTLFVSCSSSEKVEAVLVTVVDTNITTFDTLSVLNELLSDDLEILLKNPKNAASVYECIEKRATELFKKDDPDAYQQFQSFVESKKIDKEKLDYFLRTNKSIPLKKYIQTMNAAFDKCANAALKGYEI